MGSKKPKSDSTVVSGRAGNYRAPVDTAGMDPEMLPVLTGKDEYLKSPPKPAVPSPRRVAAELAGKVARVVTTPGRAIGGMGDQKKLGNLPAQIAQKQERNRQLRQDRNLREFDKRYGTGKK